MAEEEKKETAATTETSEAAETAETNPSQETQSSQGSQESQKPAVEPAKPVEPDPSSSKDSAAIDWKDLYARLKADFDNYKKRAARDRDDVYRYAESDILGDILPTVDNLALALANAKDQDDPFVKGVKLAYDTLIKSLKDHGAESFDSVGKELDTEKMEAITMMPSADVDEGKVVAEVKKGWMLKGKTLRVAQVVVSSGKTQ